MSSSRRCNIFQLRCIKPATDLRRDDSAIEYAQHHGGALEWMLRDTSLAYGQMSKKRIMSCCREVYTNRVHSAYQRRMSLMMSEDAEMIHSSSSCPLAPYSTIRQEARIPIFCNVGYRVASGWRAFSGAAGQVVDLVPVPLDGGCETPSPLGEAELLRSLACCDCDPCGLTEAPLVCASCGLLAASFLDFSILTFSSMRVCIQNGRTIEI